MKSKIIQTENKMNNKRITFIGGHPMAGSHKTGIEAARGHLFENAIYVLTPANNSSPKQVEILKDVLRHTKSTFLTLAPDDHDEMTVVIFHFLHLIDSFLLHHATI